MPQYPIAIICDENPRPYWVRAMQDSELADITTSDEFTPGWHDRTLVCIDPASLKDDVEYLLSLREHGAMLWP